MLPLFLKRILHRRTTRHCTINFRNILEHSNLTFWQGLFSAVGYCIVDHMAECFNNVNSSKVKAKEEKSAVVLSDLCPTLAQPSYRVLLCLGVLGTSKQKLCSLISFHTFCYSPQCKIVFLFFSTNTLTLLTLDQCT